MLHSLLISRLPNVTFFFHIVFDVLINRFVLLSSLLPYCLPLNSLIILRNSICFFSRVFYRVVELQTKDERSMNRLINSLLKLSPVDLMSHTWILTGIILSNKMELFHIVICSIICILPKMVMKNSATLY